MKILLGFLLKMTKEEIDLLIKLNWWLIEDGEHEAVDDKAVRKKIDKLLDEKFRKWLTVVK